VTTILFASFFVCVALLGFAVGWACGWGAGFREGSNSSYVVVAGPQSIGEAVDAGGKMPVRWDYEQAAGVN
jgi:hypothetical protein